MENVAIRAMRAEDYDIFADFYADLHRVHFEAMPTIFREKVILPPREIFEKDLKNKERAALLAEINGKPVGLCIMQLKRIPNDSEYPLIPHIIAHIDDIYVSPEFRRRGIASLLYNEAEIIGREMGADKLQLNVWSFNKAAIGLYRKLGLEPIFYKMEKMLS